MRSRDGRRGGASDGKGAGRERPLGKAGSGLEGARRLPIGGPALAPNSGRGWVLPLAMKEKQGQINPPALNK
ncbi:unnamed protein product [Rangifer tarandus platyrhynchus]|uniref:Uncharacterized protein n=1 Tax=Rangifer tarandus platyrhynchus TaxID=3082113 RepID=A0AC59ZC98_RANTA